MAAQGRAAAGGRALGAGPEAAPLYLALALIAAAQAQVAAVAARHAEAPA